MRPVNFGQMWYWPNVVLAKRCQIKMAKTGLAKCGRDQNKQCSSCLLIQEMKVTEILNVFFFTSPYHVSRHTCTVHGRGIKTWFFGSILILRSVKGLTFYQTRSNAIIPQGTLPACCIPKVVRLKTGEVLYEKSYESPRPPPKISLKHNHDWTRGNDQSGSTVEHQPVGKPVQQSFREAPRAEPSKPTQSKPNPICDRTVKPVERANTSCSQEIVGKRLQEELDSSDRTGKPVKCEDDRVMQVHDRTGKPVKASKLEQSARSWFSRTS